MTTSAAAITRAQTPPPPADRELGDILQSIAHKSPKDLAALKVLARMMLDRLDAPSPSDA